MHRVLVRVFRIGKRYARFAQDVAGNSAQSRANCRIGLQCGLVVGRLFCGAVHGRRGVEAYSYNKATYVTCALPFLGDACYMTREENQAFAAGWSSPVARQAHNLKVVGSNPTPATNLTI